ncbi:serine hydrolase domain-containing protein [Blastomonas fulva]|uniref:serine hydrolase domain-containing protein n=1 Tax=Blastomonas fulva TaxID=1550728 RepID=UPI003F7035ED
MTVTDISRRKLLGGAGLALAALPFGSPLGIGLAAESKTGSAISGFASSALATRMTPGVSAAVVTPDARIITVANGLADPQAGLAMTNSTRLMSGSTGKTFCAATLVSLAQEGVLDLDAPIAPVFADESWFVRLPNAKALNLRMLLMHGAGFPQFLDVGAFMRSYIWDAMTGKDIAYFPRKMLSFILDAAPLNAPGAAHAYSDLHYHLAGITAEMITGRSYYDLLTERVLAKLGDPHDDVTPANTRTIERLAAGYARGDVIAAMAGMTGRTTDETGVLRHDPSLEYTGGGLALTPRALARFYWKLAHGQIVSPASFAQMTGSSLPVVKTAEVTSSYGLGIFINERAEFGRYISHSGFFPGYTSNVGYFIDHGFAAAVQFNTDHGPDINQSLRDLAGRVITGKR